MALNETLLPLIMRDDVTLVSVIFEEGGRKYSYLTDHPCEKGDHVVVEGRGGFSVVTVVETNVVPRTNCNMEYKWIVDKIDLTRWNTNKVESENIRKDYARKQLEVWKQGARASITQGIEPAKLEAEDA